MIIKGMLETSFLDWDGKIVSTLFVPGCNFACPYCQNWKLIKEPESFEDISFEKISEFLLKHKGFIDGICLTGGEPCIYTDLADFFKKIKDLGFLTKLDTNGSKPKVLKKLVEKKLVDYVALDVKAPLDERYNKVAGVKVDLAKIKESINILKEANIEYEFRTTVVPTLLDENDILEIAKSIKGSRLYILQGFEPQNAMDEKLRNVRHYEREILETFARKTNDYVRTKIRGI